MGIPSLLGNARTLLGPIDAEHIGVTSPMSAFSSTCPYGDPGYGHILNNAVPLMRHKGMTKDQIHTILVDNPRRVLTFV